MSHALRAFAVGLRTVLLAPLLVLGITVATMLSVVPFGLMLGSRLQASLAQQQPVSSGAVDIDPEWWMEYRAHAKGLEATFTPAIIGFAAPMDNLSSLLDAAPRPLALAGPIVLSTVVWAFLWGGILHRFAHGRRAGLMAFVRAGASLTPKFILISVVVLPFYAVLYFAIHPTLFGLVYESLAGLVSSERGAFVARVGLYAIFAAFLMAVALVVDFARIIVATEGSQPAAAIRTSLQFVRRHKPGVVSLYLISGVVLGLMLAAYGSAEIYGGTRLGGWRAVAIGQAYIIGRLTLRLVLAASEVELWQTSVETPSGRIVAADERRQ